MAEEAATEQAREAQNSGTKPVAESHKFDESKLDAWMQRCKMPCKLRWVS